MTIIPPDAYERYERILPPEEKETLAQSLKKNRSARDEQWHNDPGAREYRKRREFENSDPDPRIKRLNALRKRMIA